MKLHSKFLAILLIIITSCKGPSLNNEADKKFTEFFSNHKELSASYLVMHDDNVLLHGAQGFFDREQNIKLSDNQQMPIASGTKQMTAAMIMRLQERGILSVEDTIAKFLPEDSDWWIDATMPDWADKVTIHQLLTHTSGIAEYIPALKFDMSLGHKKIKHLIATFAAQTPLTHEPGSKYSYSNTGYFFLGIIIESLTKQDIASIFKDEFFDPIGMADTRMASFDEAVKFQQDQLPNFPKRYFVVPTGAEPKYLPSKVDFFVVPFTDGGVISTVSDLVKWNKAFHNGDVVSEYSYKLMTTPYTEAHDLLVKNVKSGYGVYIHTLDDGRLVYYHEGRAVAIRSEHGYIPESDIYFAVLSNIMIYETPDMIGKVDYTNPANQFDIGFLRTVIWSLDSPKAKN